MIIYLILSIITFIINYKTFELWNVSFGDMDDDKLGQCMAFAILFPLYWSIVIFKNRNND